MKPSRFKPPETPSRLWRWAAFYSVGALGIVVQLGVLAGMVQGLGLHYLLAAPIAVEAAVLHNFLWHERWTWADRSRGGSWGTLRRFLLFNLSNGALSILGSLVVMRIMVGAFAVNYLLANMISIAICSVINFFASDRVVFRPATVIPFLAFLSLGMSLPINAAELKPETLRAWNAYVEAAELRMARELSSGKGFLASDFQFGAALQRSEIVAGKIPVTLMSSDSTGKRIRIPGGMVHHWLGTVFIPGTTIQEILRRVQNPDARETRQEDVLASRILERSPNSLRLYLKLQRSKFVTVVYNTEHLISYVDYGGGRASSRSIAVKIAEVDRPNTKEEREKAEGHDCGYLWRLNSYWRYEQIDGGVMVECESISLSRTIPALIAYFIRPLIDGVARESMNRTLSAMRERIVAGRG
jgi:putative flippase GtrA